MLRAPDSQIANRRHGGFGSLPRRVHAGGVNKPRKVAALYVLGAAVCLGVVWPAWLRVFAVNRNEPPRVDGPAMAVMSAFFVSCLLVVGAAGLLVAAVRRLRRK